MPLHWVLLAGLFVFLGCRVDCDPDEDPNCEPAVQSPPAAPDGSVTAETVAVTTCPNDGDACFDASTLEGYEAVGSYCDAVSFTEEADGDTIHCVWSTDPDSGDLERHCWSGQTGEKLASEALPYGPPGECTAVEGAAADINADGLLEPCVAFDGNIQCSINNGTGFDEACPYASYPGDVVALEGCPGPSCNTLQLSTSDESSNWVSTPGYVCADGIQAPDRVTTAPSGSEIVASSSGDFNGDGFRDHVDLFMGDGAGTCTAGLYFNDGTGDRPPVCGGAIEGLPYCSEILAADAFGGPDVDFTVCGSLDEAGESGLCVALEGNLDTPGSACTDQFGLSNDQELIPEGPGSVGAPSVFDRDGDGRAGICVARPSRNEVLCWDNQELEPRRTAKISASGPMPVFEPDPLGPYPTGGHPVDIIVGRDVNLDGKPEFLTINTDPGNYTLIFSSASTRPDPSPLDGRITADEPWFGNGNGMPIGLIGDMLLVGAPGDTEGAGSNTGAVFVFKLEGRRWVQKQKIIPTEPVLGMRFGYSLAVEEQIDTGEAWMIVGSRTFNDFEGRVDLYRRVDDSWEHFQTLTTDANDFLGWDVDINVDIPIGQSEPEWTAAIGAPGYRFQGNNSNTGTVYVSVRTTELWSAPAIPLNTDTVPDNNIGLGRAVAIDGDVIVAGAPGQRVDNNNGAGAVYVFTRGEFSPWVMSNQILNPNPQPGEINGANFGFSVDVVKQVVTPRIPTGNYYYLVGAPRNTSEYEGGEVYVFGGGNPGYQRFRRPGGGDPNDQFGHSVAFRDDLIRGNHLIVASTNFLQTGRAYIFDQPDFPEPWVAVAELEIPDTDVAPNATAVIGESVAAWDDFVAVSTSNLASGNDAVFIDILSLLRDRFEAEED